MIMRPVPADSLDAVWARVAPLLRQFLAKYPDAWTVGQMYDLIASEHRQLYIVVDGREVISAVITMISDDRKTLVVPVVAGVDADAWAGPVLDNLEGMARENGIERIHLHPRLGWTKVIGLKPSDGWKEIQRTYEKVL